MNHDKCALIITSSVYISARYTVLSDPEERKKQYLDSITFFITQTQFKKIIVCDNSAFIYPPLLNELSAKHGKELELLSFSGDNELVARYGKGYGEGEIMKYVMLNSSLLKSVEGFFKITGRLKLVNADQLLENCKSTENYFMPVSLLRPRFMVPAAARACVDVRVYYANISFFKEVMLEAYQSVRDDQTYFLEHAYHDAMLKSKNTIKCFPIAPEITGMSGSNGWIQQERSGFKKAMIRFVSRLGYIKPLYKP